MSLLPMNMAQFGGQAMPNVGQATGQAGGQVPFWMNPWVQMGTSILANDGNVGRGMQQGMANLQQARQMQAINQMNQLRMQQLQAQQAQRVAQQKAQRELVGQTGTPEEQARLQLLATAYPQLFQKRLEQQMFPPQAGPRRTARDVHNRLRYLDTGELAFKDVVVPGEGVDSGRPDPEAEKIRFDRATKLRKEFTDVTKEFAKINDSYGRIVASASDPSAAGDLAMIFNFMKMLDPGSVVRESEYATAENAAGVPARIRRLWNKARDGTKLAPTQRQDFINRAGKLYGEATTGYTKRRDEYSRISQRFDIDPEDVIFERQLYDVVEDEPANGAEDEPTGAAGGEWSFERVE